MLSVTVQISGNDRVKAKLKKLGQSFYQLQSAMESIGENLDDYYSGRAFLSQGGVFKNRWAPLADSTIKSRDHGAGTSNAQPLITNHSNGMQFSFKHKATQTGVVIGNAKDYFKYHQSSAPRGSNLPRRQMLGITNPVKDTINHIINAEIKNKIRAAGL